MLSDRATLSKKAFRDLYTARTFLVAPRTVFFSKRDEGVEKVELCVSSHATPRRGRDRRAPVSKGSAATLAPGRGERELAVRLAAVLFLPLWSVETRAADYSRSLFEITPRPVAQKLTHRSVGFTRRRVAVESTLITQTANLCPVLGVRRFLDERSV
jgi:hypothetical protein